MFYTVDLIIDLADGTRTPLDRGSAMLAPSVQLTDVPDQFIAATAPVQAQFGTSYPPAFPQVQGLAATDNTGPQPSGWGWTVSFPGVPGSPAAFSFFLPAGPAAFTATDASPCVFTWTPPGGEAWQLQSLPDGTGIRLSAAFGGFETGTTYYAVASSGYTFSLAATPGGAPLASTAAGSGELTAVQYNLSALTPVQDVTAMQAYLPVPSGTPAEGDTILMSGSGYGSSFGPPGGGSGTVTSVSVASANGFAGTVATPSTTPAVTLETTVTGLLKGNGTGVSAAVAGTDYLAPSGSGAALTGITAAQVGADASGAAATAQSNAESFATSAVATETSRAEAAEALLAPKASPALTGIPTAPTASPLTDDTQLATTAYADAAVAAETSRAEAAEALLAPKASPAFTGTPAAPTAPALTDSTQLATTAYADAAVAVETTRAEAAEALKAPLASPALTGSPTAPTQTTGDSSTKIATDAFVTTAVAAETTRAEAAEALAAQKSANLSDLASATTARTNLGLGSAATQASSAFDPAGAASTAQANAEAYALPVAGGTMTGWLAPKVVTLTDGATVALDAALGNDFRWTLAGNAHTLQAPSSPVDGQAITIDIQQPASGGPYTVTWTTTGAGCMDFGTDGAPVLSTAASAVDTVGFRYHAGLARWLCMGWKLGF